MLKDEHKIIAFSAIGGFLLWAIDAAIDSLLFSHGTFLNSLIFDISPHELYFRSFFLLAMLGFGLVFSRMLSRRRLIEDDLRSALERLKNEIARSDSILAAIGDGISIQDNRFTILYQNKVQQRLIGGDGKGQICYRAYAGEASVCVDCPVEKSFRDGGIHTLEKTAAHNGAVRTLEIKASPLLDASGRVVAGIEAIRDITDRKKEQEDLKLFSEAIEVAMDGVQIIDLAGTVVYSNKAAADIRGYTPAELSGTRVDEMFAERTDVPWRKETERWSGECAVVNRNGATVPVSLSTSLVKDASGEPIAMIGIFRDITERKQAEGILKQHHEHLRRLVEERTTELSEANEQLRNEILNREKMEQEIVKAQKLESLGVLAGGLAHDFNNLLASIMGNISLAMMDLNPGDDAVRRLEVAEKVSLRAQDLTRQLLTFSRGGAPIKKAVAIGDLLREASAFALWGGRATCDFSLPDDPLHADIDEGQISQVLHNLLINADHAMPSGGVIEIRSENVNVDESSDLPVPPGAYVKIGIRDHGTGIPPEHLSKIFDPYFTTKKMGSGLGLATSYSIIKRHGGHIAAESVFGEGATFTLHLPAAEAAATSARPDAERLQKGEGKILLMDDEEDVMRTTGDVLARLGYSVEFSRDGAQAIELYRAARESGKPFDAVIMDLTVPGGMGGVEALGKMREMDPAIKAIVSSGYSNDPIMAEYGKHGFSGCVAKPYRITDLDKTLHAVLNDKAAGTPDER
jgi:PAS domain S-box-containing protein